MDIPIRNIYYLLCYAWDMLEEGKRSEVGSDDYQDAINLVSRVLLNGLSYLFKRGLDRDYLNYVDEYPGIKGKIVFSESLRKNSFRHGKAVCSFDQFDYNIIQNQIIKSTLYRITKVKGLDNELRREVWLYFKKFKYVDQVEIQPQLFKQLKIHRNNSYYLFLLRLCHMIYEATVINEIDGSYHFKEFLGSDKALAALFEAFIRNFYRKEQDEYKVGRDNINWNATPLTDSNIDLLPRMQTDVSLVSDEKKIVIETKFYKDTTSSYFDIEKFHSTNLYQLYSYIRNLESDTRHPQNQKCEGILLYPTVEKEYDESYLIEGHKFRIVTIDLARDWNSIYDGLLDII